jgi:uncharacterized protein YjiS (DUF1127 family)
MTLRWSIDAPDPSPKPATAPGHIQDGLADRVRQASQRLLESVRHELRCRAGERALAELDDDRLADLGLTRAEIHAAAYGLLDRNARPPSSVHAVTASAMRRTAAAILALFIWSGPAAWATEQQGWRHLPSVGDLPLGTVKVSPFVPGMGVHWANPKDLPLGPIYCVMKGKVICAEFMVAQKDLLRGRSFERLRLKMKGKLPPVDHVELTYMPHGHEGYTIPHYDLHLYFVPPAERFPRRQEGR